MFCLDCDYPLDFLDVNRCPECGREFDLQDPTTFRVRLLNPRMVYRARNHMQAHFLAEVLMREGVLPVIREETPGFSGISDCSIWVAPEDYELAYGIIVESSSVENDAVSDAGWICPSCGELIESQFGVCWNCQTKRVDDSDDED